MRVKYKKAVNAFICICCHCDQRSLNKNTHAGHPTGYALQMKGADIDRQIPQTTQRNIIQGRIAGPFAD